MDAILNFALPLTQHNINNGPIVKLDPNTVYWCSSWNFVTLYTHLEVRYQLFTTHFRFMVAILNFFVISACVTNDKDLLEFIQLKT